MKTFIVYIFKVVVRPGYSMILFVPSLPAGNKRFWFTDHIHLFNTFEFSVSLARPQLARSTEIPGFRSSLIEVVHKIRIETKQ